MNSQLSDRKKNMSQDIVLTLHVRVGSKCCKAYEPYLQRSPEQWRECLLETHRMSNPWTNKANQGTAVSSLHILCGEELIFGAVAQSRHGAWLLLEKVPRLLKRIPQLIKQCLFFRPYHPFHNDLNEAPGQPAFEKTHRGYSLSPRFCC